MKYWIFIVSDHRSFGVTSEDVLNQRLQDQFWGLGENTQNRNTLESGDQVVFYLATPLKCFAATATLATASVELSGSQQEALLHGNEFYRTRFGVRLDNIQVWKTRKPIASLVAGLAFIENKGAWGSYLQGGVRGIEEADFASIVGGDPNVSSGTPSTADIESQAEFALENHLEDFLDRNWRAVDFGCALEKYSSSDQDGRQFSAGSWNIDFLCTDKASGDLVVIELKKGKTSDATVGQTLRYMGWVRKNIAKENRRVRGIIIAKEVDEAMRYAVENQPDIRVLEYRVDFKLSPPRQTD